MVLEVFGPCNNELLFRLDPYPGGALYGAGLAAHLRLSTLGARLKAQAYPECKAGTNPWTWFCFDDGLWLLWRACGHDDLSPEVCHEPLQQVLQSDLEKFHSPRSVQRLPLWIRRRSTLRFKLPKMPSPLWASGG